MLINTKKVNVNQLLTAAVLVLITLILYNYDLSQLTYLNICYIVVVDIIICAILFVTTKQAHIGNACFLFWFITTIFSFGQNVAYIFIYENPGTYSILYDKMYSIESMAKGTSFTLLAYNFLSLGLTLCFDSNKVSEKKTYDDKYVGEMELVSKVLIAVSVIPQIIYMYSQTTVFMAYGYGYSATENLPGIVQILRYWFIPGIIVSYVAKSIGGKRIRLESAVFLVVAVMFLLTGDRGSALSMLLVLIFLRNIFKQGKKRTIYIWCVLIVLLIPFVKFFRIAFSGQTSGALSEAFSEMLASNPLIDMLLELGSTQQIIIMTMRRVATEGFAYGKAYLDFFVKMLPSFVGIQTFYPTLAKWVIGTTAYQTKGFSIWGESYLNFGGWGIPFMFVIGRLFQKLLKVDENSSPLKISLAAVSLSFFADVSRRSISEFGFVFLYDIILPIVAIWVLSEVHKRKEI